MKRRVQAFELSSETEVQTVLERLERAFDGSRARGETSETGVEKERRRYLDTFDWRIHRSGGWLGEVPGKQGVTLLWSARGRAPRSVGAARGPAFATDLPAGRVRKDLEAIVAPRRLLPVAEVLRATETFELLGGEGQIVGRVKAVTNQIGGLSKPDTTARLLLEGVRGHDDELQVVDRFIRDQLRLRTTEVREIDEILDRLGFDAGRDPSALDIQLSEKLNAGEAVRQILARLRDIVAVNRNGALEGLDTEYLHDFRVAVRRTRSVLGQLKQVLPATTVQHYLGEFRWLGDVTGAARDLDVFLLNMSMYRGQLPDTDAGALDALERLLVADRKREQTRLEKALRGERFEELLANWKAFLEEPSSADDPRGKSLPLAERPVREVASRCTWKRYKRVRRIGRGIDRETEAAQLHRLRIQCKKLRYLLEVFRSLHPAEPIARGIKELKRLQNTLGEFNDAQVHAEMLRGFATRLGKRKSESPETIVAIGLLVSGLLANTEKERGRFFGRWEGFDTAENRARYRSLFRAKGNAKP